MFIFFSEGNGNDFLVRSVFSYLCSMSRERLSRKRRNKEMNILCDVLECNIAECFKSLFVFLLALRARQNTALLA